jgi:hypothetical protein
VFVKLIPLVRGMDESSTAACEHLDELLQFNIINENMRAAFATLKLAVNKQATKSCS